MLPTPEEERIAVAALITALGLCVLGAMAAMVLVAFALGKIAGWIFG